MLLHAEISESEFIHCNILFFLMRNIIYYMEEVELGIV